MLARPAENGFPGLKRVGTVPCQSRRALSLSYGDGEFESRSLQRRVHCEPDFLDPDKSCFWLRGRLPSCLSARRIARAGAALEAVPGAEVVSGGVTLH